MSKQDIDTIEGFTIVSMKASRLQKQNYQNIQWAQGMGEQKPRRKETSFFIEESSVELKPEKKTKPQKAAKPAPPPLLQKHEKQTMPKNATYSYNDKGQIQFGKLVWVLWEGDNTWYGGHVAAVEASRFYVQYSDKQERWESFHNRAFFTVGKRPTTVDKSVATVEEVVKEVVTATPSKKRPRVDKAMFYERCKTRPHGKCCLSVKTGRCMFCEKVMMDLTGIVNDTYPWLGN